MKNQMARIGLLSSRRQIFCSASLVAMVSFFLVSGCREFRSQPAESIQSVAGDTAMIRTELYFGLSRRGGDEITSQQFDTFVAEVVTPRFPDGLTILDGNGQWRDPGGNVVREKSKLLIVLHPAGPVPAKAIEEIRGQFKSRFGQESVMRVTSSAGVAF